MKKSTYIFNRPKNYFTYWLNKLICRIVGHKWEVVDWYSVEKSVHKDVDEVYTLNTRKDICKKCSKQRFEIDDKALDVLRFRKEMWEQRRKILIEKNKNPKRYVVTCTYSPAYAYLKPFISDEVTFFDSELDYAKGEFRKWKNDGSISKVRLVCLDKEKTPEGIEPDDYL